MRELTEQEIVRRDKLKDIKEVCNPYPDRFLRTHSLKDARNLSDGEVNVAIAGRIIFMRKMGKLSFVRIRDLEGDMQLEFKVDMLGEEKYSFFKKQIDTGDFIGVRGEIFTTQTGEKTLRVHTYEFLGKALRPLPEKFHGLADIELKYRQRYVDLITNEESRKVFLAKSKYYLFIRNFLSSKGFLEVETPVIQTAVSGATAKPFFTHYNALDLDCNLRIAPECYLKECIAAGFDKVYEIGRVFRNEGMDIRHNPEFTMLELYASYQDFHDMMDITEKIFSQTAQKVLGTTKITYQGQEIDLAPGWKRITMIDSIKEACGVDFNKITTDEEAVALAKERGIEIPDSTKETRGDVISLFFDEYVEKTLIQPTFIYEYPVEISPLAKKCPNNKKMTERFEVFIGGREYGNAFSELNDPIDQYERFKKQVEAKEAGDEEAGMMDEDYIQALEIGLPPTGGLGIGIDRLVMLLTDAASIRDVLLFPTMKPLN